MVLPYAFDTNDVRFFNNMALSLETILLITVLMHLIGFAKRVFFAPRMLSIGLHTRIIGKPARIDGLEKLLDYILEHKGIWLSTRQI